MRRILCCVGAVAAVTTFSVWMTAQSSTRLTDVIRSGDAPRAMEMLKQGPKSLALTEDADGMTALHWAARIDDAGLAKTLLAAGAKVGAANRYGITPLALAAVNGSTSMVEVLLNAGADPNATSGKGETVLMAAARTGRPDPLKLLLSKGANPNAAEREFGETAIMWAAAHDHPEAVHVLAKGGANLNARTNLIELPKAKVDFSFAVATALPRGGLTALMLAARQGKINGVTALADAGADLNLTDPEGATAIVIAIINAHYDVAARLAEKGADSNIGDAAGMAALYAAVDMEHPASLTNRPTARASGKMSAADLVDVLLKHRADPNVTLKAPLLMRQHNTGDAALGAGATPLMRAAKALDLRLIKALLDNGADPSRKLANGTTTLAVTMTGRGARTLTPDTPTYQAIRMMLEKGADVNAVTNGATLLHQSLDRGEPFVRLLVEKGGARLDLKDGTGRTPLDIATGVAPAAPPAGAPAAGRGARGALGGARGGPGGPGGPGASAAPAIDAATIAFLRERSAQ